MPTVEQLNLENTSASPEGGQEPHGGSVLLECYVPFDCSSGGLHYKEMLVNMFKEHFTGMSRVDFVECYANVKFNKVGQSFFACFANVGTTATMMHLRATKNAVHVGSNEMNCQNQLRYRLVAEDRFSVQVQPTSAMLPTPEFHIQIDGNPDVTLLFVFKIHGSIQKYHATIRAGKVGGRT